MTVRKTSLGFLRISLRGWLLGFLFVNLALGAFVYRASKRKEAVEAFQRFGGTVHFDFESEKHTNSNFVFADREPSMLRPYLHDSAVHEVVIISFVNAERDVDDRDLRYLGPLSEVRCLCLMRIEAFGIEKCRMTDAGVEHLLSLKRVEVLQIGGAPLTDRAAAQLSRLTTLRKLWLNDAKLTDAGLESLAELPNLVELCVRGTFVTKGGVESFRKRSPHCEVHWDGD